jgi:AmiR/NasT family two-component response regulator
MAKESTDPVAAFNALRNAARSRRSKIGLVAEHVLETGALPA